MEPNWIIYDFKSNEPLKMNYREWLEMKEMEKEKLVIETVEFKEIRANWQVINPIEIDEVIDFIENYLAKES